VRAFPWGNPLLSMLFQRLDLRNHRKIAVIDDRVAFTGSRNCADMAFAIKPRYAPWVDILLRVEGPVVRQIEAVFLQDWMSYTGQDLGDQLPMVPPAAEPGAIAQVLASGPDLRQDQLPDSITTLIFAARESLTITTPYYVPDEAIDAAICAAARRGVRVTIVLPERNDSRIVAATSEGYFYDLLTAGVRVMLFKGGLLHAKIVTVDGRMALAGSANLDRRSFDLNYEVNLFVIDDAFTAALDARQASYIARARPVTLVEVRGWGRLRRMRNNLFALATPLL
jgi:cardiolipin synthase